MADSSYSISSPEAKADAEAFHDNEKLAGMSVSDSFGELKTPDELEIGDDIERAELLPQSPASEQPQDPENTSVKTSALWMIVNTLATIGIVGSCHPDRDLLLISSRRSSRIKQSSQILLLSLRNSPLLLSISSSHGLRYSHSLGHDSPCSSQDGLPSNKLSLWLLPCH